MYNLKRKWNLEKYYSEIDYDYWSIIINGVPTAYNKECYSLYQALMETFTPETLKIINES